MKFPNTKLTREEIRGNYKVECQQCGKSVSLYDSGCIKCMDARDCEDFDAVIRLMKKHGEL
jgi:hypothetical protein